MRLIGARSQHQAAERVGGGRRERQDGRRVLEQTADVVARRVTEAGIAALIPEEVLAALPQ